MEDEKKVTPETERPSAKMRWADEEPPKPKMAPPDPTKKRNDKMVLLVRLLGIVVLLVIIFCAGILPNLRYSKAVKLQEEGKYAEAQAIFEKLDSHKDSKTRAKQCAEELEKLSFDDTESGN